MPCQSSGEQERASQGGGLVIGLGGAALPIYLHNVFSFNVDCMGLDETVRISGTP